MAKLFCRIRSMALFAVCLLLLACSSQKIGFYADAEPKLDLRRYFIGKVEAWGMFQNRSGEVVKRFKVDITGYTRGQQLVLDERFVYQDGSTQQRIWQLTESSPGNWLGVADDVVGQAEGRVAGNALQWRYTLRLPVDGTVYEVEFDDWMYLINDKVMVNRSSLRKFGVELGQVTLFFQKVS